MALAPCPACGTPASTAATICPKCGQPLGSGKKGLHGCLIAILAVVALGGLAVGSCLCLGMTGSVAESRAKAKRVADDRARVAEEAAQSAALASARVAANDRMASLERELVFPTALLSVASSTGGGETGTSIHTSIHNDVPGVSSGGVLRASPIVGKRVNYGVWGLSFNAPTRSPADLAPKGGVRALDVGDGDFQWFAIESGPLARNYARYRQADFIVCTPDYARARKEGFGALIRWLDANGK